MLHALEMAYLRNNSLTETIPDAVGNCSKLGMLSLHTNDLSGSLPPSLCRLQNLIYLWLGSCDEVAASLIAWAKWQTCERYANYELVNSTNSWAGYSPTLSLARNLLGP